MPLAVRSLNERTSPMAVFALCALLAACGGGGGGTGGGGGGVLPPASNPPTTTSASGTLVDRNTNSPLGGIPVAIEPWVANSTPIPEGTTSPTGAFAFTATNGHYLLIIGSDSPADTRATVHDNITLNGGAQVLVAPTVPPVIANPPAPAQPPSETSAHYRLMTLDPSVQTPCLQAVNQQRTTRVLSALVPDEWLMENTYEHVGIYVAQGTGLNIISNLNITLHNDGVGGGLRTTCASWVANDTFNPTLQFTWSGYQMATATGPLWYGGAFAQYSTTPTVNYHGQEEWGYDPRIDSACPTPPPSPLPTPGPGACDPVYMAWP